jgi:hypothetical protein
MKKKGKNMNKRYAVSYEGWLIIHAKDEQAAATEANEILGSSNLINNGESGEWLLADIEEEEE